MGLALSLLAKPQICWRLHNVAGRDISSPLGGTKETKVVVAAPKEREAVLLFFFRAVCLLFYLFLFLFLYGSFPFFRSCLFLFFFSFLFFFLSCSLHSRLLFSAQTGEQEKGRGSKKSENW